MTFSVVEWFVLIFSVVAIIKIVVVSFSPRSWINIVQPLYKSRIGLFAAELVLAAALFYFLLMELTIVQIMAGMTLGALLTGMIFALYGNETISWAKGLTKGKSMLQKVWLPAVIWLALAIWALISIFN